MRERSHGAKPEKGVTSALLVPMVTAQFSLHGKLTSVGDVS